MTSEQRRFLDMYKNIFIRAPWHIRAWEWLKGQFKRRKKKPTRAWLETADGQFLAVSPELAQQFVVGSSINIGADGVKRTVVTGVHVC